MQKRRVIDAPRGGGGGRGGGSLSNNGMASTSAGGRRVMVLPSSLAANANSSGSFWRPSAVWVLIAACVFCIFVLTSNTFLRKGATSMISGISRHHLAFKPNAKRKTNNKDKMDKLVGGGIRKQRPLKPGEGIPVDDDTDTEEEPVMGSDDNGTNEEEAIVQVPQAGGEEVKKDYNKVGGLESIFKGILGPAAPSSPPTSGAKGREDKPAQIPEKIDPDALEGDLPTDDWKALKESAASSRPDLPPYARDNTFYHQASYKCKPLGRLDYQIPVRINADGSRMEPTGGWPTYVAWKQKDKLHRPPTENMQTHLFYPPWTMSWPPFFREKHKSWFAAYEIATWRRSTGCPEVPGKLNFCEKRYTDGDVMVKKATAVAGEPAGHDCGPDGNLNILTGNAVGRGAARTVDTLYWAVIPATWTFQHWHENTLPKIAASLELVPDMMQWSNVSATQELLLDRYPIIAEIYKHMNWEVFDERSQPIQANTLVYSCRTPPLHPYLWQQGQQWVLKVRPRPMAERKKIVYCGRTKAGRIENAGRRVLNEEAVVQALRKWEAQGFELAEYDHRQHPTVASLNEFFSEARLLIGPHGGCLTNVMHIPCNSAVIELFPLVNGVKPPVAHPAMMMYMQSTYLEQDYYMLPVYTTDSGGDMTVPIDELEEILAKAMKTFP